MSEAFNKVLSGFNGQLGLVNTAVGAKNPDGTINISGTAQGVASTVPKPPIWRAIWPAWVWAFTNQPLGALQPVWGSQ
jgi:hypothetical protein